MTKFKMRLGSPLILGVGMWVLALTANAQSLINVNFGPPPGPLTNNRVGLAATGLKTNDVWNYYYKNEASPTLSHLLAADGTETGVSISVANVYNSVYVPLNDAMLGSFLYATGESEMAVTISGLAPGNYALYAYGHGNLASQNSRFNVVGDAEDSKATAGTDGWNNAGWIPGKQYVVFTNVTAFAESNVTLTVRKESSLFAVLNGLQIVRHVPADDGLSAEWRLQYFGENAFADARANAFADPDGDGDTNLQEFQAGTDPLVNSHPPVPDFLDGIANAWKLEHFGKGYASDPDAAAAADPDGDGASNLQEYLGGTDPKSATSIPYAPVTVTTYAGSTMGSANGPRAEATFTRPNTLARDAAGKIYVIENSQSPPSNRIRVIGTDGTVATFAGGEEAGLVEGKGIEARFNNPIDMVFDSHGNAFVAELNNQRIRKIDTEGNVTTFAGTTVGFQDGPGETAQFNLPFGIAIDANDNLYVADFGNNRVRKITPEGVVSTYIGAAEEGNPAPAVTASLSGPNDVAMGPDGTLYISDYYHRRVCKVSGGEFSTFANIGTALERVWADAGGVYVVINAQHRLVKYSLAGTLLWSLEFPQGLQDGPVGIARANDISKPLPLPDGTILFVDSANTRIRQITLGIAPVVAVNPPGGLFTNSIAVSITAQSVPDLVVRYTLDGSDPTTNSPVRAGGLTLTNSANVKVRGFIHSYPVTQILSRQYSRVYAFANDGIPASWREQYFGADYLTNPIAAADADPDNDGGSNLQEYLAGSDPLNSLSGFAVTIKLTPVISWNSIPGAHYRIWRKEGVTGTDKVLVVASYAATETVSTYVDLGAPNNSFYTVEVIP